LESTHPSEKHKREYVWVFDSTKAHLIPGVSRQMQSPITQRLNLEPMLAIEQSTLRSSSLTVKRNKDRIEFVSISVRIGTV
jgi:hypothetical protein